MTENLREPGKSPDIDLREWALSPLSSPVSRRRFLALAGASAALATGASCSRIDRGAIVPYTRKPVEVVPGAATYYASTFPEGTIPHGVLVKTREGRPIHVEGNAEHPHSAGFAGQRAIGDVLGLYDPDRLRRPWMDGGPADWASAISRLAVAVREARDAGKAVLLLTGAVTSPTARAVIADLKKAVPTLRHAAWEPAASDPAAAAAREVYGEALIPDLRFDRADVVLSLGCDFLGVEGNVPVSIRRFASRRSPVGPASGMSRLWVLEGPLTLTGANADRRLGVRPSRLAWLAFALARMLHEARGVRLPDGVPAEALAPFGEEAAEKELGIPRAVIALLAADLARAGRNSLAVAGGSLPPEAHAACHLLNVMLGGEGWTVDATLSPPDAGLATLAEMRDLVAAAGRGEVGAAIVWGTNPAHAFPDAAAWKAAAAKVPVAARIGLHQDETASGCRIVFPENHWLESWGDHEAALDVLSLQQPAIGPLHDTRQGEEILLGLLRALGAPAAGSYHDYLMERWRAEVCPKDTAVPFERSWCAALHDGVYRRPATPRAPRAPRAAAIAEAARRAAGPAATPGLELVLSTSPSLLDGRYAGNGWLQELPDPITRMTWGNPLAIAPADAEKLGLADGDVVRLEAGGAALETPVLVQDGQAPGVLSLALGYGRIGSSVAEGIGANAFALLDSSSSAPALRRDASLVPLGRRVALPRVQEHQRLDGRDIARSWKLSEWADKAREASGEKKDIHTLYARQAFPEQKWGMAIDLSSCVGCGACVVACQSENNIAVVGPEQVIRGREMHWIRIDRYYEGDRRDPLVHFQPMLCQNCDDAPCENVCPVNATTHSQDGLNQMAYNRCVGTRYCANNCPYKVRRFNFLDFTSTKREPESLAYNPEVTVRPRGVMEKCTFCIQRIQDARQRAKAEGRAPRDGEIRPACAAACPASAIVFGDLKDPASRVSLLSRSDRGYKVLEDLGVRPAVTYLADIRNPGGDEHGA